MIEEIWKPVKGYEGLYEVSNWARVKSLNYRRTGREEILKLQTDTGGYLYVFLCKNGKATNKGISVLVAEAFIPNPENKKTVDHINKIRNDNRVENLQWLTQSENVKKGFEQGRTLPPKTEKHRLAIAKRNKEKKQIISTWTNEKLNLEFIGNPRDLVKAFPDQKLSFGNLSNVRTGKYNYHKGWTIKS